MCSAFSWLGFMRHLGGSKEQPNFAGLAALWVVGASLFFVAIAAATEGGDIAIELNKLEPQGQACRAYVVVFNKSDKEYQSLNLDLVLFRPDGVVGRRVAINLAPLKADKRIVKLFDIDGTPCAQVGSVLINDVLECKTDSGPVDDCLKDISVSTITNVQLTK
jgi:hypothetical protein